MTSLHHSPSALLEQIDLAVLRVLIYFETFRHPLLPEEVRRFCSMSVVETAEVTTALKRCVARSLAWEFEGYYQTVNDPAWVAQRKEKNLLADRMLPMAHRAGRLIRQFPYVRGVMVSGSLSKHCMTPDGDIDFFIVTAPGRLWLARTLLVLFKKVFLFNSRRYFCVNYFIDTQHLEITPQNLFTAMECATLLPIADSEWYCRILEHNPWIRAAYFPNATFYPESCGKATFLQKITEKTFNNRLGTWLDIQSMHLTCWFWKRKFSHFDEKIFDQALHSRRYISRHHPLQFQEKVLRRYQERCDALPLHQ